MQRNRPLHTPFVVLAIPVGSTGAVLRLLLLVAAAAEHVLEETVELRADREEEEGEDAEGRYKEVDARHDGRALRAGAIA